MQKRQINHSMNMNRHNNLKHNNPGHNNFKRNKYYLGIVILLSFSLVLIIVIISLLLFNSCKKEKYAPTPTTVQESETIQTKEKVTAETPSEESKLPQNIQELIDKADSYFNEGEYSLASKSYRDAILAIENLTLNEDKKDELLDYLNLRYKETEEIVDTARMHHANAMQLQYEKRFEEAIQELELALKIYPKYQPAIDALETLKALKDLN